MMQIVGTDMSHNPAKQVFETSGVGPHEVDVVELHDFFTSNEIISYEALGLIGEGEAERFVSDVDNTYGGRMVVTLRVVYFLRDIRLVQPVSFNVPN